MRVYVAAAMTNAGRDLATIRALVDHLEARHHEVPSRHVADPAGREPAAAITDRELARRDLAWITGCDALIAEVSTPSHGVGIEVGAALALGKPVLLLYRAGTIVSRLLLGLPRIEAAAYDRTDDIAGVVESFLGKVEAGPAAVGAE